MAQKEIALMQVRMGVQRDDLRVMAKSRIEQS